MPKRTRSKIGKSKRATAPGGKIEEGANGAAAPRRPLWSGTLSFGLVTLPVELYPTTRSSRASLRLVSEGGAPLKRTYFSQVDGKPLTAKDIVRGYPLEDDEYVTFEDAELDALDPERSRVIDLQSFVPLDEIDPGYTQNTYLLVPDPDAATAYRLLVSSMAAAERAGIATFVMRGRSYVVAIISLAGSLRAITMRYHDELRTPDDVGLPELDTAEVAEVARIEKAITTLAAKSLRPSELEDRASRRLRELAQRKLEQGEDVYQVDEEEVSYDEDGPTIDIMALLKKSLGKAAEA